MTIENNLKAIGSASKNLVLAFAIFLLTLFVVIYGINTFYDRPEYTDYCPEFRTAEFINNSARCEEVGGQWTSYNGVKAPGAVEGFCDRDYTCRMEYEEADERYARNIFLWSIPIAIVIIVLGAFVFQLNSVGVGLMFGGVGTLIYGAGRYWRYSDNLLKFLISLVALVFLIYIAYWFNKRSEKKK